mgnify:CR=1 FL=1
MRHGLLLTAVVSVTVPGVLAMLAVVGHDHVAADASISMAALDGAPLSSPPVTVLSKVSAAQEFMGASLLSGAADAGSATSYQGTELISQSGMDGSVKLISKVWHQGGGLTVVESSDGTTTAAAASSPSSGMGSPDPVSDAQQGVFGVTKPLVALLAKHYVAVDRGTGAAVGRAATVVELYRFDGSLAARYWLDQQTMVPLRRELFDTADNVISEDSFVQVNFGADAVPKFSAAAARAVKAKALTSTQTAAQPSWVTAAAPAGFVASLAEQGWEVPATLPGGLPLYTAAWAKTASGEVVELEYSDGLYVVSLFLQRGRLAANMAGWRPVAVSGQQAFVSGQSVTWSGLGFVYTMIAEAPPQTMTQVVGELSRGGSPGVIDRLGRGFTRLAHVINPFG